MAGERKLEVRRKDPDPDVAAALRRKDEDRFAEADLERERLHGLVVERAGIGEDRELVARERGVGEDIGDDVAITLHYVAASTVASTGGAGARLIVCRRAISFASSQRTNSTTAGSAPHSHCRPVSCCALSSEVRAPPRPIRSARTISATITRLTVLLLSVSSRRIVAVWSRHSRAATTSMRENATSPIVLPISTLS